MKIKLARNGEIILLFTDEGNLSPSCVFFNVANMSLNAIRENKILTKISDFTVLMVYEQKPPLNSHADTFSVAIQ